MVFRANMIEIMAPKKTVPLKSFKSINKFGEDTDAGRDAVSGDG